jgi:hypothetical protein
LASWSSSLAEIILDEEEEEEEGVSKVNIKGTVSRDRFHNNLQKFTKLGLSKGRGWFLNFLWAPMNSYCKKCIYCGQCQFALAS